MKYKKVVIDHLNCIFSTISVSPVVPFLLRFGVHWYNIFFSTSHRA